MLQIGSFSRRSVLGQTKDHDVYFLSFIFLSCWLAVGHPILGLSFEFMMLRLTSTFLMYFSRAVTLSLSSLSLSFYLILTL